MMIIGVMMRIIGLVNVMMVMMTTDCIGQEVFMKRPPHWEQACCLMYTPSCCNVCNMTMVFC